MLYFPINRDGIYSSRERRQSLKSYFSNDSQFAAREVFCSYVKLYLLRKTGDALDIRRPTLGSYKDSLDSSQSWVMILSQFSLSCALCLTSHLSLSPGRYEDLLNYSQHYRSLCAIHVIVPFMYTLIYSYLYKGCPNDQRYCVSNFTFLFIKSIDSYMICDFFSILCFQVL